MKEPLLSFNVSQTFAAGIMSKIKTAKDLIRHYQDPELPGDIKPSTRSIHDEYEAIKEALEFYAAHTVMPEQMIEMLKYEFKLLDKQLNQSTCK